MPNNRPRTVTANMTIYQRNYRAKRKALGICNNCTEPLSKERRERGFQRCYDCQVLSYKPTDKPRGKNKATVL